MIYVLGDDHYETLGIHRGATERDIKRAYKKLAIKFHPDRNKGNKEAEKKFIKVSHAYDILKDPKKREEYDTYGQTHEEFQQRGGHHGGDYDHYSSPFSDHYYGQYNQGFDPFETFKHFFNEEHHDEEEYDEFGNEFNQATNVEVMEFSEFDALVNMGTHPFSHHPHLIFLFSGMNCHSCSTILQTLDNIHHGLSSFINFKMINIEFQEWIPKEIKNLPSIIYVKDGKIVEFSDGMFSSQTVLNFIHKNLPKSDLKKLRNEIEVNSFLRSKKNEIRVILFSLKKEPTILQKEINFVFKDYLHFRHYFVQSKNDQIFKTFKQLKYQTLPTIYIKNEDNDPIWHDKVDKEILFELFGQHGIEEIPKMKSINMLNDYCFYDDYCFIYSTKSKNVEKKTKEILKSLKNKKNRISIILNQKNENSENLYEKLKSILKIKKKHFFVCLNLKRKEFKIFNDPEFNSFQLKDWMDKVKNQEFQKFQSNSFMNEDFKKNSFLRRYSPLIISFSFFIFVVLLRVLTK
eukprot:gene3905-7118_t